MKAIEKFREDLKNDKTLIGVSISFTDPLVTDALADSTDFFWIDLEHTAMSIEALGGHLLAARSHKKTALVRVSGSSTPFIKMVLDAGADGIIVPQVKSVEEVNQVVRDCRYPPVGQRGYGPRVPSNYGRNGGKDYIEWANKNIFVAVQIETLEAFNAIDEILGIPGLDSLVIGPWDLSAAFGMLGDVEHPVVTGAIETIIQKTRKAGLFIGAGMGPDADYAYVMAKRGIQWLQVGGDFGYLVKTAEELSFNIRKRLGEDVTKARTSY